MQRLGPRGCAGRSAGAPAPALLLLRSLPRRSSLGERRRGHVVLVVQHVVVSAAVGLLLGGDDFLRRARNHGFARDLHVELERGLVLDEPHTREWKMLRVI